VFPPRMAAVLVVGDVEIKAMEPHHISGVLELQSRNTHKSLSPDEAESDGFLSCVHNEDYLRGLLATAPSCVAVVKGTDTVVGYSLSVIPSKEGISRAIAVNCILEPLFGLLTELYPDSDYVLGGQLCVDKSQRGKSLAVAILKHQGVLLSSAGLPFKPRFVVTEIAAGNARSIRAHEKAGYVEVMRHVSAGARQTPETWVMVALPI
jgi:hypothetical protein